MRRNRPELQRSALHGTRQCCYAHDALLSHLTAPRTNGLQLHAAAAHPAARAGAQQLNNQHVCICQRLAKVSERTERLGTARYWQRWQQRTGRVASSRVYRRRGGRPPAGLGASPRTELEPLSSANPSTAAPVGAVHEAAARQCAPLQGTLGLRCGYHHGIAHRCARPCSPQRRTRVQSAVRELGQLALKGRAGRAPTRHMAAAPSSQPWSGASACLQLWTKKNLRRRCWWCASLCLLALRRLLATHLIRWWLQLRQASLDLT